MGAVGRPHWSLGLNPGVRGVGGGGSGPATLVAWPHPGVRGVGGGGSGPATLVAWPQPRCEGSRGWGQWAGHTGRLASTPV